MKSLRNVAFLMLLTLFVGTKSQDLFAVCDECDPTCAGYHQECHGCSEDPEARCTYYCNYFSRNVDHVDAQESYACGTEMVPNYEITCYCQ